MKFEVNGIKIQPDQIYESKIFQKKKPNITTSPENIDPNYLYTTLMVDPDAPYPSNPTAKYFIHLMVINSNDIIIEYYPPNPPADSEPHKYQVFLYKQEKYIQLNSIHETKPHGSFDLENFVKSNRLVQVDSFQFRCKK